MLGKHQHISKDKKNNTSDLTLFYFNVTRSHTHKKGINISTLPLVYEIYRNTCIYYTKETLQQQGLFFYTFC
jgi:hypothetical protein